MTTNANDAHFLTTRWSLVRAAKGDNNAARKSLGELCGAYWYPLYAYLRRRGAQHDEAQDSVQAFFLAIMQRGDLAVLDPELGRFRGWLLAGLRNFCAKQRAHDAALKRGGTHTTLSIDWEDARERFSLEPADARTPEAEFDRAWALATLERARCALRAEYVGRDKQELFDALAPELDPGAPGRDREQLAATLKLREGALKVAIHRLRQRFGEALRREIGDTLSDPEDLDSELNELLRALGAH